MCGNERREVQETKFARTDAGVVFVHDGINSVADYISLRVGVGWMSYVVCLSPGKFHDWITFKRLKILG